MEVMTYPVEPTRASRGKIFASLLVSTCVLLAGTALVRSATTERALAIPAVRGLVDDCRQHPVVIIGEVHWLKAAGDFYIRLVRDPEFQRTVQDIVVEFASRNNQPLLDRYIAGEDVPTQDVRRIWRDTTKVASWESPIYAQWLAAIREVNRGLPAQRRLRVLAGDTPVDWSRMRNHSDWAALGDNNVSFADVIIDQVLKKKRRALVVLGTNHVTKSGDRDGGENTTTRVDSHYPGSTHVVLLIYHRTLDRAAQDLLRLPEQTSPVLFELSASSLSKVADLDNSPLIKKADALLYLGPPDSLQMASPPAGSLEPAYLKEVDRRSMIEWGELRARKFLGAAAQ